ncbi:MAG TPA: PAS domain S-box protein [Vicinamibacterales bacterium]|nr:PAS domain S-box protein [Vicinamibacterales bacterium]
MGAPEHARRTEQDSLLVQSLPVAIYTCDADGRITLYNEAARALWGRTPELNTDRWCGSFKLYREVRGEELLVERPDGTRRSVICYPEALRDASGALLSTVNTLIDITDQKQSQLALRESDDRLRRCFEIGMVGMAITSVSKGILEVNNELCRILGYERSELLQKTWAEMTHPDDLAADLAQFTRVMAGEIDGYSMDKRWIRKNGEVIDSIMAARCQRRADGSVDFFVGLVQDITERRRAEMETIALKNVLSLGLAAMTRLHEFSTRLYAEMNLDQLLDEALEAIVALQGADAGTLQLHNPESGRFEVLAYRGIATESLDSFLDGGAEGGSTYARALREYTHVIVEDVETDPAFAPYRQAALAAQVRAVHSTPMLSGSRQPLGVISTYFRRPYRPDALVLRMTDLYARQAAEMVESKRSSAVLQDLTMRLIEGQEVQSKHLAHELHDVFSQRLAAIGMEVARISEASGQSGQALAGPLLKVTELIGGLAKDIHGLSLKSSAGTEILTAIREVLAGRSFMSSAVNEQAIETSVHRRGAARTGLDRLSRRQREVVQLAAEGRSTKQISTALGISPRTVEFHRYAAMKSLDLHTIAELVQYAIKHHIVLL